MARRTLLDRVLGLPPVERAKVMVYHDLAVAMRDGAVLRADRYVPAAYPGHTVLSAPRPA